MNAPFLQPPRHRLSLTELRSRWRRMLEDPLLRDLAGKVELNQKGAIELTPANPRHGRLQALVASELRRLRPDGETITECPIETALGIRVPDIVWASRDFVRRHHLDHPFPSAPELCVEVLSPANSRVEIDEKVAAYLEAGAIEVWLIAEDGDVRMFDASGAINTSSLGVVLALPR